MQSTYICPIFKKWLQLHPEHARQERIKLQAQANQYQQAGDFSQAYISSGQVYDICKAIVLAPRAPNWEPEQDSHDLLALAAAAIHLAKYHHYAGAPQKANNVLSMTQHQLTSLMPLYSSEPKLIDLIQSVIKSLQLGQDTLKPQANAVTTHAQQNNPTNAAMQQAQLSYH
jgi:hypothetical protein